MQEDRTPKLPVDEMLDKELSDIPADTDKTELPQKVERFLKLLAERDEVYWEPYLARFKERFDLTDRELNPYRALLKKYQAQFQKRLNQLNSRSTDADLNYKAHFPGLVDIVDQDGKSAFLIKTDKGIEVTDRATVEGEVYFPPPKEKLRWLLPRWSEVQRYFYRCNPDHISEADAVLYDDLVKYHIGISELPGEDYYHLLAAWVMHTYLIEAFQYTPYLWLYGLAGRGKTRTGKGIIYASCRGMIFETLREAHLLRCADHLKAVLFIDVQDIQKRALKEGSIDILLYRYERGATVPRVLYPERGPIDDTVYYSVFGATLIGTNEAVNGPLQDRTLQIRMSETQDTYNQDVKPEDALGLKERLTAFRAMHMGKDLPQVYKPYPGRIGDLLRPLMQIVTLVRPEYLEVFERLGKKFQTERKHEKADSPECLILQAVLECLKAPSKINNGKLSSGDITDVYNFQFNPGYPVKPNKIGKILSAMGFDRDRTSAGKGAIVIDLKKIEQLKKECGL